MWSFPNITLDVKYHFVPDGGGTRLTERMTVTAGRWLIGYVVRTAMRVQRQTLDNLKARLESTG